MYKGGGYGFKLFTLELKIIDALQQIFFSSKFIIISYNAHVKLEIWVLKLREAGAFVSHLTHFCYFG
jgi:hypothetical protein